MFNQGPMYQPFSGLASKIPKAGINWGNILNNTQKTLSIINQAIPVFYQVKPIWNNAKTMFKVMGEMGKISSNNNSRSNVSNNNFTSTTATNQNQESTFQNDGPSFFI